MGAGGRNKNREAYLTWLRRYLMDDWVGPSDGAAWGVEAAGAAPMGAGLPVAITATAVSLCGCREEGAARLEVLDLRPFRALLREYTDADVRLPQEFSIPSYTMHASSHYTLAQVWARAVHTLDILRQESAESPETIIINIAIHRPDG